MKYLSNYFLALAIFSAGLNMTFAAEYRSKVLVIANAFKNPDPDIQYIARRDLEILVSEATAPGEARGASRITEDLLYALSSEDVNEEAKKYILRQLARVGTSKAVSPLSRIMLGKNERLAEEARAAIESIPGNKASNALKKAYSKWDTEGKTVIITSLAHRGEASSVRFLAKELGSESERIAVRAAWALGEIGNAGAYAALRRAYRNAASTEVKKEIERSILSNPSIASSLLRDIFSEGSHVASRAAALKTLIERDDSGVGEALSNAMESDDADLRTIAIDSALSSGDENLQDRILDQVPSMDPGDLATVLGGLESVDRKTAESIALQIYEKGDETLQLGVLELLGTIGSEESIDLLLNTVAEGKRAYQIKAASALAQLDVTELDERLAEMLKSGDPENILLAQEILVYRNIPDAKSYLFEAVSSDHGPVARGALKTLSVIANSADLDRLYEIAMAKSGGARRTIVALLKKLAPEFGSTDLQAKVAKL